MRIIILAGCLVVIGSSICSRQLKIAQILNIELGLREKEHTPRDNQKKHRQKPRQWAFPSSEILSIEVPQSIIIFENNIGTDQKYAQLEAIASQTRSTYTFATSDNIVTSYDPLLALEGICNNAHKSGPGILLLEACEKILSIQSLSRKLISFLEHNKNLLIVLSCQQFNPYQLSADLREKLIKLCEPFDGHSFELYADYR